MKNLLAFFLTFLAVESFAASSFEVETLQDKRHVTADRTLYHSNEKVYEAFGHVVVSSEGQRLSADYLWLDTRTNDLKARGNVIFVDKTTTMQAAELHYNLETGVGSIYYGKVYNDLYTLKGQLIRRVAEDRFLTTEGEYSTCKDCPESWKLSARNVDLTVDGYAFMDNVFVKIKDIPTLYLPYAVLPVKTRRQTGLLFPRISFSVGNHGSVFVQPLFIAIDDHQDATISVGRYSSRGARYEGEYRYKSYDGIAGTANVFFTKDRKFSHRAGERLAFRTEHKLPLARHFDAKLRILEVRDRDYVIDFEEDMPGRYLPSLESNGVVNAPFSDFFLSAEVRRYRNLLYDNPKGFDGGTVQATPTVHMGVKERSLVGPFLGSFYGRYDNFNRVNGPYDEVNGNDIYDPDFIQAGPIPVEPEFIREAHRFILAPEISAPFRVGRFLMLSPSLQYNQRSYAFRLPSVNQNLSNTSTTYVQARLDASTVFERIYNYDGETVSKLKHQLSPYITFYNIPWIQRDNRHPFQRQLERSDGLFDQFDTIPMTNSTNFLRFPQGKSIHYGFTSRLIRKMKSQEEMPRAYPFDILPPKKPKIYPKPKNLKQELEIEREKLWAAHNPDYGKYQEMWTVSVSQAYDFKDRNRLNAFGQVDRKFAFSYLLATSTFSIPHFSHSLEYRFYPRITKSAEGGKPAQTFSNKHYFSTGLTWELASLTNLRKTRSFQRTIELGFTNSSHPNAARSVSTSITWALNDFVSSKLNYSYDLLAKNQTSWGASTILTHSSECWGLLFRYDWSRSGTPKRGELGAELLFNLMGTGFQGSDSFRQGGGPAGVFGGI